MNRAEQIVDTLLSGAPVAPTKPTTKPAKPATPSKPRPGTRPWNPQRRPGVDPRPKARERDNGWGFSEAEGAVTVPPAAHDDDPQAKPEPVPLERLCDRIRRGDVITIQTPQGQTVSGRAVMPNQQYGCWVLNLGGPHGRPGIATEDNIVSVRRGGKVIYGE